MVEDDVRIKIIYAQRMDGSGKFDKILKRSTRKTRHRLSKIWKLNRLKVLERDNNTCIDCGGTGYEVHHKSYDRIGTPEEVDDCVTLCYKCHLKAHNKKDNCAIQMENYKKKLENKLFGGKNG